MNQFEVVFSHIVRGKEVQETNWISTPVWETELSIEDAIKTLEEDYGCGQQYNVTEIHSIKAIQ